MSQTFCPYNPAQHLVLRTALKKVDAPTYLITDWVD